MLFEGETTLGEVFSDSGYATGMFGKWHLGDNYPYRPEDRGFQEVVRHGGGGVGQTPDFWDNSYYDDTYWHNGVPTQYEGYCSDVYFDTAKAFIEDSVKEDKPFFAYICTNAPHSPFHADEKYWKHYLEQGITDREAIFFGMIENIDENVAEMREFLEKKGLTENTLFMFTTDNGTASEKTFSIQACGERRGSMYEGGHRVPMFIHWPAGGFSKGRDIDQLTLISTCYRPWLICAALICPWTMRWTDVRSFHSCSIRPHPGLTAPLSPILSVCFTRSSGNPAV